MAVSSFVSKIKSYVHASWCYKVAWAFVPKIDTIFMLRGGPKGHEGLFSIPKNTQFYGTDKGLVTQPSSIITNLNGIVNKK